MTTLATIVIGVFLFFLGWRAAIWSMHFTRDDEMGFKSPRPFSQKRRFYLISRILRSSSSAWWGNFLQGISTEMFGAIITTVFLGIIVTFVQNAELTEQRKQDLILQMGSPNNSIALEAVRQLRALDWLEGDLLVGANLASGDLTNADLQGINLTGVNFASATLISVDFFGATLTGADLSYARAKSAVFINADLHDAKLYSADLEEAIITGADLTGANLISADLENTRFELLSIVMDNIAMLVTGTAGEVMGRDEPIQASENMTASARQLRVIQLHHLDYLQSLFDPFPTPDKDIPALFDEMSYLPDIETYDPALGPEQLERFTDREHPDFWRASDPVSPAFEPDPVGE